MFYNVHTHLSANGEGVLSICNLDSAEAFRDNAYYSVGIHPWYASDLMRSDILSMANKRNVLAIGECGLDKLTSTPLPIQVAVFEKQIELANELNKPLIIHCVKAYEEVLASLRKKNNKQPVVFHGFNKNEYWMKRLVDLGYYLSVGKALHNEVFQSVFVNIPIEFLFLETDDAPVSIESQYMKAAQRLAVSELALKRQVATNFTKVFYL